MTIEKTPKANVLRLSRFFLYASTTPEMAKMTFLKKKLAFYPALKSAYQESCPPKKLFLRRFFLENHYSDPFRSNDAPQVLYMAGKLWISALRW